jgi:hypothetical protein
MIDFSSIPLFIGSFNKYLWWVKLKQINKGTKNPSALEKHWVPAAQDPTSRSTLSLGGWGITVLWAKHDGGYYSKWPFYSEKNRINFCTAFSPRYSFPVEK